MVKLRTKVFLLVVIGIVPLAAAAALAVSLVNDSHREDVARLEAAVLTEKAHEIQNFVNGDILRQVHVIIPQGPGLDTATSAQKFAFVETLAARPFFMSLSFIDRNGKETTHLDRAHPGGYAAAALRDMSGTPEFQAARAGNFYVGPVAYAGGMPSVLFSSPVEDDAGNLVGVIAGSANLDQVAAIVADAAVGGTGYLYLVDGNGLVIGGGGPFRSAAATSSAAAFPIVRSVLNGNDLTTAAAEMSYASVAGDPVVAAATYLPAYGWGLVAEWPTREANALIASLFARNAIALVAVLAIAFAISAFFGASIVRPVKKLEEGAKRVQAGRFDEGVYIKTGDELESLGNSFNDMVQGLKQLEELKDEFVFIAAHELKTPVAAMKGYLSLILDGNAGEISLKAREYIEKVIASDNRLVQLVSDLLEVARSQAGRLTIKVGAMELPPPIRAVLDELKSLADEKGVKMAYEPPAGLPRVLADADRVKEVMVNLVGNAVKYMGGSGMVTISHELRNGVVVTHVADTGLGMSKEAQAKLFSKFYRVQTEKTRDIAGTGLGLFIVKQIVEKMGGTISVASEEGKGSTFSFGLPAAA